MSSVLWNYSSRPFPFIFVIGLNIATEDGNPTSSATVTHPTSNIILVGFPFGRIPMAPTKSIMEVGITQLDMVMTDLVIAVSVTALPAQT